HSAAIIAMIVASTALIVFFPVTQHRAAEPIMPLELFRNTIFRVSGIVGFIVGFALFGAVTYMPLYLQVVKGHSPTISGLQLTPMMGGVLVTSIASGNLITRFGRYKPFPIAGTAIMTVGMFLLSTLGVDAVPADRRRDRRLDLRRDLLEPAVVGAREPVAEGRPSARERQPGRDQGAAARRPRAVHRLGRVVAAAGLPRRDGHRVSGVPVHVAAARAPVAADHQPGERRREHPAAARRDLGARARAARRQPAASRGSPPHVRGAARAQRREPVAGRELAA